MKCHSCGTELPEGAKFCLECGQRVKPEKTPLLSNDEIAQIEAESQSEEYAAQLKEIIEEGLSVERRDVAILFVDVSGFSAILGALSSEQVREVMRDVYSVMSGAITRCGGYVNKFIGDEVMAVFGAPIASERPCERAITAVDEIEIGLAAVSFRFKDVLPMPLSVHAGAAWGPVEAGKVGESQKLEYEFLGETVNTAKRLTDAALSSTVLVSSEAKSLTDQTFNFETLGVQQLPGMAKPIEVFRLTGPKAVAGERRRFSELGASMFGREVEFDALKAAFDRLQSSYPGPKPCEAGEGQYHDTSRIFGITGEAGIGKSRLKQELKHYISDRIGGDGAAVLVGSGWGIGQTPLYWPIKEQIALALGFDLTAKAEVIAGRLSSLKQDAALEAEYIPYLYHLFSLKDPDNPLPELEPKSVRDNLWIAIRKFYERLSMEKPLVLVFEDMHWADGGTIDYLEYLAEFVSDFPVLILVLYRPGYEPKFARIERVPFTELRIGRLSDQAETSLLDFYLAQGDEERVLIRRIRAYCEGNPLFAEEFLRLLLDRGNLKLENGKMRLTSPLEKMALPTRLSGVLAERFDRLDRSDKRVAYYGAVIGRSFLHGLLSDLHGQLHGSREVRDALRALVSREIVLEHPLEPDTEYTFKHALTREILVSRLVESLRRELSRLIAVRIEALYEGRLDEFHGMLSEHYEVAGKHDKAARHSAFCAIHDQKHQRNHEALEAFERYDRFCQHLDKGILSPQEQADLLESRIAVLDVLGRWGESVQLCDQLAGLEDGKWQARALAAQSKLKRQMGDHDKALELGKQAILLAQRHNEHKAEAQSILTIGTVRYSRGDYDEALKCFERALVIYRESGDKGGTGRVMCNIGSLHTERGDFDKALRCYEEALHLSQDVDDKGGIATTVANMAELHRRWGRLDEALRYYRQALAMHWELGKKASIAIVVGNMGAVHHGRGDYSQALRCFEESLAMRRELGDKFGAARVVSNVGIVHRSLGDYDKAMRCYEEALSTHRELNDKRGIAIVAGSMGSVHADRGDYNEALRCFEESLSMWRELGGKPGQGFNLCSIAGIRAERGEWTEARRAAEKAEQFWRETGSADYAPEVLSIRCLCHAAERDWASFASYEAQTLAASKKTSSPNLALACLLNLAKAHLQVAEWHDDAQGDAPPLSRNETIAKATDYAKEARSLAESKGVEIFVEKAEQLLAEIDIRR